MFVQNLLSGFCSGFGYRSSTAPVSQDEARSRGILIKTMGAGSVPSISQIRRDFLPLLADPPRYEARLEQHLMSINN